MTAYSIKGKVLRHMLSRLLSRWGSLCFSTLALRLLCEEDTSTLHASALACCTLPASTCKGIAHEGQHSAPHDAQLLAGGLALQEEVSASARLQKQSQAKLQGHCTAPS